MSNKHPKQQMALNLQWALLLCRRPFEQPKELSSAAVNKLLCWFQLPECTSAALKHGSKHGSMLHSHCSFMGTFRGGHTSLCLSWTFPGRRPGTLALHDFLALALSRGSN